MHKREVKNIVTVAIKEEKRLVLVTHSYLTPERKVIDTILHDYLDSLHFGDLKEKISYCVHEIASNAKKANTKRVYFTENNLDIFDPSDYQKGMTTFRTETFDNIHHYVRKQIENNLYVKLTFQKKDSILSIIVENNSPITPFEKSRIEKKLQYAKNCRNMTEILDSVGDDSEGSGLGLVMTILMLRNIGFDDSCFCIRYQEAETITELNLHMEYLRCNLISNVS